MTRDQDPALRALFLRAARINREGAFIEQVMAQVDRLRRKASIGWLIAGLLLVAIAWLLSGPVIDATALLTQLLPASLVDVENQLLAQLLAPINSVAGAIALLFLLLCFAYKKLFR